MKIKNLKRFVKILIFGIFLVNATILFAAGSDDIYLPDLTTEIEGDAESIKPEVDFPVSEGNFNIPKKVEKLVESKVEEEPEPEPVMLEEQPVSKVESPISFEGLIGGGFPGFFVGDFSVFNGQEENPNPFKINFKHETAEGYFGQPFSSGYNDKETLVFGEKRFTYKNVIFDLSGMYKSLENGLQNKVPEITSFDQRAYSGDASITWTLPKGFSLYAGFDAGLYNRFADSLPESELPDWVEDISIFSLKPEFKVSWNNENAGVTLFFDTKYFLDSDTKNNLIDGSNKTAHRGEFKIGLLWETDFIKLFGDAAAVVGNQIGNNNVIVPFTLGMDTQIPVTFSDRKIKIEMAGGLSSERTDIEKLEESYKFSLLSFLPNETSDWFGKAEFEIPFQSYLTINLFGEYRKTAVENGVWQPVYKSEYLVNGGYLYNLLNRQLIKTHGAVSYTYKFFTINVGWLSFWDFVPVGYDRQSVTADLIFQSLNSVWGASVKTKFGIVTDDSIPNIGFEAFVYVKPQVRIAVEVSDTIKLIKAESRIYAGQYAARGGSASLFVKVCF